MKWKAKVQMAPKYIELEASGILSDHVTLVSFLVFDCSERLVFWKIEKDYYFHV